jgi:hypothetical protein
MDCPKDKLGIKEIEKEKQGKQRKQGKQAREGREGREERYGKSGKDKKQGRTLTEPTYPLPNFPIYLETLHTFVQ